jgi:hypothetical protein
MNQFNSTISGINEIDSIHQANVLYWRQGPEHSREAAAEYERRKERLEEIRAVQLAQRGLSN